MNSFIEFFPLEMFLKNHTLGLGDGSMGKCLPHRHKNLSSDPKPSCKKLGTVAHSCSSRAGEVATGRYLWLTGQPV